MQQLKLMHRLIRGAQAVIVFSAYIEIVVATLFWKKFFSTLFCVMKRGFVVLCEIVPMK
jgi:hypothetical protein